MINVGERKRREKIEGELSYLSMLKFQWDLLLFIYLFIYFLELLRVGFKERRITKYLQKDCKDLNEETRINIKKKKENKR